MGNYQVFLPFWTEREGESDIHMPRHIISLPGARYLVISGTTRGAVYVKTQKSATRMCVTSLIRSRHTGRRWSIEDITSNGAEIKIKVLTSKLPFDFINDS